MFNFMCFNSENGYWFFFCVYGLSIQVASAQIKYSDFPRLSGRIKSYLAAEKVAQLMGIYEMKPKKSKGGEKFANEN